MLKNRFPLGKSSYRRDLSVSDVDKNEQVSPFSKAPSDAIVLGIMTSYKKLFLLYNDIYCIYCTMHISEIETSFICWIKCIFINTISVLNRAHGVFTAPQPSIGGSPALWMTSCSLLGMDSTRFFRYWLFTTFFVLTGQLGCSLGCTNWYISVAV
jgi:hypothetical protein